MSDEINYLTPAELYAIAEDVLGRKPDVRDRRLLHSTAARPALIVFGEEVFPTVFDKAAALLHSVAARHVFFDGNKRTATAVAARFLQLNGLQPVWDADTIYHFVLDVAQNKWDVKDIAAWLSDHTQPL
ncbi:MAG TPA: type II toxin-antitoxin system death-on-curing family toxin [Aggregatilineaceae bacterium]|nr:type II toxin-antitoxin system death-on-curing family toxin [Aggregatilineaceae bacterium]